MRHCLKSIDKNGMSPFFLPARALLLSKGAVVEAGETTAHTRVWGFGRERALSFGTVADRVHREQDAGGFHVWTTLGDSVLLQTNRVATPTGLNSATQISKNAGSGGGTSDRNAAPESVARSLFRSRDVRKRPPAFEVEASSVRIKMQTRVKSPYKPFCRDQGIADRVRCVFLR